VTDLGAILAELDEFGQVPQMQPGDVTVDMLCDRWDCSPSTAKARVGKAVDAGLFETLMVQDPDSRRPRRVWRKL